MAFSPAPLGTAMVDLKSGYASQTWGVWFNQVLYQKLREGITSAQVISALGYTPYNAANPANYISTITGTMVLDALGYTPYNASNPSGYISGITGAMVTSALGFTPISGIDSGMITSALGFTPLADAPSDGTTYGRKNGAWAAAGSTGPVRTTASVTTGSIAAGATSNVTIDLSKSTTILKIATDYPAWVRIYVTAAARTADSARPSTSYPVAGAGVVADTITTASSLGVWQDPTSVFANNDSPVTATAYVLITNQDTVSRAITLTVTHLPLES